MFCLCDLLPKLIKIPKSKLIFRMENVCVGALLNVECGDAKVTFQKWKHEKTPKIKYLCDATISRQYKKLNKHKRWPHSQI